jgi:hypothetical protein
MKIAVQYSAYVYNTLTINKEQWCDYIAFWISFRCLNLKMFEVIMCYVYDDCGVWVDSWREMESPKRSANYQTDGKIKVFAINACF